MKISISKMKFYPVGYLNVILSVHGKKADVVGREYDDDMKVPLDHLLPKDAVAEFSSRGIEATICKV